MFLMYQTIINFKIERNELTKDFVSKTKGQLNYYLEKKQISKDNYEMLISLMDGGSHNNE